MEYGVISRLDVRALMAGCPRSNGLYTAAPMVKFLTSSELSGSTQKKLKEGSLRLFLRQRWLLGGIVRRPQNHLSVSKVLFKWFLHCIFSPEGTILSLTLMGCAQEDGLMGNS